MNYQYLNQHNQSTVETSTAVSEERNKIHAHNGCGCGKDLCLFPWGMMAQTKNLKGHIVFALFVISFVFFTFY